VSELLFSKSECKGTAFFRYMQIKMKKN